MKFNRFAGLALLLALVAAPAFSQNQAPEGWATQSKEFMAFQDGKTQQVYTVKTLKELKAALASKESKTIYVDGMINGTEDESGKVKTPADYLLEAGFKPTDKNKDVYWEQFWGLDKDGKFIPGGYLAAYDPANYTKDMPEGELEEIRSKASKQQAKDITLNINSNTKIIGLGKDSGFKDIQLIVKGAENVIIRNLTFIAVTDYFPGWEPKDGSKGNWNSEYDTLSISESKGVWIDHNKFMDAPERADYTAPHFYGRLFQQHDGLLDIVRGSDLVTVSNNIFQDHYKTMLWGNSDGRKSDEGTLRISFYNNHMKNISERAPRVRYGKVHLLNNYYEGDTLKKGALEKGKNQYFVDYTIGNGIEAKVFAEGNVFEYNSPEIEPTKKLIKNFKGSMFHDEGSMLNGKPINLVDYVGEGADMKKVEVSTNVKWNPKDEYKYTPMKLEEVKAYVLKNAGPGKIEIKQQ